MSAFHGKLLLIDNNNDFLDEVMKDSKLINEYPLIIQKTCAHGIKVFQKNKSFFRAVIVATHFFQTEESLKEFQSAIGDYPLIYISHKENHLLRSHFENAVNIREPKNYEALISLAMKFIDKKADWKNYVESHEQKFIELKLVEDEYIPIDLKDFMIFPKSFFNLYIKIGDQNFIKVVNAGEEGAKEIIDRYAAKGFELLYLPLVEHEKYVALCEKVSSKAVLSPTLNAKEKLKNNFRFGNEVSKNILKMGVEPKSLDYAEAFLHQSVSLIKNYKIKDGNLKKFIEDIENNEHAAGVSFLAGVLADELGFESAKSVKLVGVASLVHDIGLHDLAPWTDEKTLAQMSDVMMKHSKHGADLLRKSGCFEEVVCLAVEQHHMRRRGGETSTRSSNLNLVSEIVGVSDAFYNMVLKDGFEDKNLEYFLEVELKKFSHHIEKGLLVVLGKKRKAG